MASLRQSPRRKAAVEVAYLTVSRPLRIMMSRISFRLRRSAANEAAEPLRLRRLNKDGPG
jgi:hypothetical protein